MSAMRPGRTAAAAKPLSRDPCSLPSRAAAVSLVSCPWCATLRQYFNDHQFCRYKIISTKSTSNDYTAMVSKCSPCTQRTGANTAPWLSNFSLL
ncbi:hypothetical protein ATCV1_z140R [Acanthocystis turfacea chlorella virus 1]|uniref:Uncharacterized protein z140R n=1 Tax=Chlorovirus heliozoae TaxID=322019 RepID=A7K8A0_9PHYC|nr:hypothetical protein ATCV1_z140R [Acanthocystis turfacea chlorella virus 1]ABT16274.1 hypothetical protein ATCV1_z140R [Acanthocystis turfacea chlorella virus 1]